MRALRRSRVAAFGLFVLAVHAGCAVTGTYEPRPYHRISKLDPAGRVYARDGRRFEPGFMADGEDLVSGNELAVAYARRAHRQHIAGLTLYGVGLAAMSTGIGLLSVSGQGDGRFLAGNVLLVTALVPILVSAGFVLAGHHNLEDAVNIYNDALESPIDPRAFEDHPPPGGR